MHRWTSDSEGEAEPAGEENPLQLDNSDVLPPVLIKTSTTVRSSRTREEEEECRAKKAIVMEFGDEYFGEVIMERGAVVPHGTGTLHSSLGQHCYVGDFAHRWRDGYGKLVTDRYVLWSKWRMNRPDLNSSVRIDYAKGEKYCGFIYMQLNNAAVQHLSRGVRSRLSKFSVWALTSVPTRERWGELVGANGDRYFGQWEEDLPCGFGCLATAGGDRYIGLFEAGKFHDTGTLFTLSYARGAPLLDGAQFILSASRDVKGCRESFAHVGNSQSAGSASGHWGGVIYDGVWDHGRFAGEGHVTLPCGSRVSADWRSTSHPSGGRVFLSASRAQLGMGTRGWFNCFHWEPLLCGAPAESCAREYSACQPYRDRLQAAMTAEEVHAVLADFCASQPSLRSALKVFCRCFFFLHGTCGRSDEIGGGPGANSLGWCNQRNAYGGCVHRGRGRPIGPGDVDLALTDIVSFAHSAQRWVVAMLGDAALADYSAEVFVARRVLDTLLRETHHVLLNLYVHAFSKEDAALAAALERFRGRTSLDDFGADFARRASDEKLFDPYADAVRGIEQLGAGVVTFSGKLRVLAQWSKEIDLSARLAQLRLDDRLQPRRGTAPAAGSADDLLPIHQYVLVRARLRHLYAHARMLVDLSGADTFMDFTSRENFLVTTLHACVTMAAQLHPRLRDEGRVLAPPAMFEARLRLALDGLRSAADTFVDSRASGADLCDAARAYLRAWLPAAVDGLAARATVPNATVPSGTNPNATDPSGTNPNATDPSGTNPNATDPSGTNPSATDPSGTNPNATDPSGTNPSATDPSGTNPNATDPSGTNPSATDPSGTNPNATDPSGTNPSATDPSGTNPSATDPSGTNPNATDPSGTNPSATDPSGTNPNATDPSGTNPSATDPSGTNPNATDPSGTNPSATDPSGTNPNATDPSGTNPSATVPSGTVPNATVPSGTNPNGTGLGCDGNDDDGWAPVAELLQNARARAVAALDERQCPRGAMLFFWLAASRAASALGVAVRLRASGVGDFDVGTDAASLLSRYEEWLRWRGDAQVVVVLRLHEAHKPFFLRRAAAMLLVEL